MPTDRPAVESTVICVVPWPYSAVQLRTWPTSWGACPGQPWARMSSPRTQTSAAKPPHGSVSTNLSMVLSGPAPRSVTRLLLPKLMPDERRYVPASRNTTRSAQHDAHQRRHRAGRPAERRESPDDHRGCGASQRRGQHVLPDRVDDRGDAEARRPPRIPQRRNRENAEIRDPRRRDPERAPPEAEEKQNGDHRKLEDPPAEQAVRPSDGKVDPDLDEIDEHQPGRGREEREDQTRLRPLGAQQQAQQIPADQSQVHTQSHADEREGRERAEQMPAASRGVSREATEGRHGHTCDRSRDFDRNREEVECLLVESERLRAKSPPDQEVVHVPHEVADREASVRVDREPQRRDRAVVAPWQPGDPSTPYPGARRRGQR